MQDLVWTKMCVGCRTCELACSYHHRNIFSPSIASIHIEKRDKEAKFGIRLYHQPEDGHLACSDDCDFYWQYCPPYARDELRLIVKREMRGR